MSAAAGQVTDTNGTTYRLARRIGRGGQGSVFAVEGGRLAVKIVRDTSPTNRTRLRNQLAAVRRLDLEGLEIARPLVMLREPDLGYTMELVTGMEPLQRLASVPRGTESVHSWYQAAGGLRRRLRLLARTGDVFASLHGRGLTYTDPSPGNIFVSAAVDRVEVRLIDADNIHHATAATAATVYTPMYGAPELVRGTSPANSLSDAHAFSVVVFQVLSLVHPLIGDAVEDGPPELEDRALAGGLPWIDSPADTTNSSSAGIPRTYVLSARLADLAAEAFGPGLNEPTRRPGVSEWAARLHTAADSTVTCARCKSTFFLNTDTCPWCEAPRPGLIMASFHVYDPASPAPGHLLERPPGGRSGPRPFAWIGMTKGESVIVTDRLARGTTGLGSSRQVLDVHWHDEVITLQALDGAICRLVNRRGSESAIGEEGEELPIRKDLGTWSVHLGEPDSLHRVMRFVPYGSVES